MGYRTKTNGATKGGLGSAECSAAAEKSLLTDPKTAKNARRNARETLEGGAMASSYARLTPMQVLGPTLMVSRSILVARAGIRARLMSVTYARGLIRLQNSTKTRPIAAPRGT